MVLSTKPKYAVALVISSNGFDHIAYTPIMKDLTSAQANKVYDFMRAWFQLGKLIERKPVSKNKNSKSKKVRNDVCCNGDGCNGCDP